MSELEYPVSAVSQSAAARFSAPASAQVKRRVNHRIVEPSDSGRPPMKYFVCGRGPSLNTHNIL